MNSNRIESNAKAVERTCYELCETGRFMDAYMFLQGSRERFINLEEFADIQQSLIDDYPEYRDLM